MDNVFKSNNLIVTDTYMCQLDLAPSYLRVYAAFVVHRDIQRRRRADTTDIGVERCIYRSDSSLSSLCAE